MTENVPIFTYTYTIYLPITYLYINIISLHFTNIVYKTSVTFDETLI